MKRNILNILTLGVLMVFYTSCAEDVADKPDFSSVNDAPSGVLTGTTIVENYGMFLTVEGSSVTSDGNSPIMENGICWDLTNNNPKLFIRTDTTYTSKINEVGDTIILKDVNFIKENSVASPTQGIGGFSAFIGGLKPSTTYYYRAYSANSQGITYGEVKTFTTNALQTVTAVITSELVEDTYEVEVAPLIVLNQYIVLDIYGDGYDITLKVNGSAVTVDKQPAWRHSTYGVASVRGTGTFNGKTFVLKLEHTVAAGSFGTMTDQIVLP